MDISSGGLLCALKGCQAAGGAEKQRIMTEKQGIMTEKQGIMTENQGIMTENQGITNMTEKQGIMSVSTLGRIIVIRSQRFYLAPCCCSVQPYTGRGDEFMPGLACFHQKGKPQSRPARNRCGVCNNVAVSEGHTAVDHLTGVRHTMWLCHRHTPHEVALRYVVNWAQLNEAVALRERPLFQGKKKY